MPLFRARTGSFVGCATALLCAVGLWVTRPRESPATSRPLCAMRPGQCYAVPVRGLLAHCHVGAEPCDLFVGSLGDPAETYRIRLAVCETGAPNEGELVPLAPLRWRQTDTAGVPIASLPAPGESWSAPAVSRDTREFWLHVADLPLEDARGYERIAARLVHAGTSACVYADCRLTSTEVAFDLVENIVALLDEQVIPRSQTILGTAADIDGDGRLAVLLTPALARLQGGRTAVNGFVRCQDFNLEGEAPFSNRADVLFLNAHLPRGTGLAALLAHEYTHAVCSSLRMAQPGPPRYEEDWLNEGLAHVAEKLHGADGSNLDHRVARFLEDPAATPLVVRDYYRAGLWRDDAVRGATYLFLKWCIDGAGESLLRRVAASPATGTENVARATGIPFTTLHRHWAIALHTGVIGHQGSDASPRASRPQPVIWKPDHGPLELTLRGTATSCVRIIPQAGTAPRRIALEARDGARLHATVRLTVAGDDFAPRPEDQSAAAPGPARR